MPAHWRESAAFCICMSSAPVGNQRQPTFPGRGQSALEQPVVPPVEQVEQSGKQTSDGWMNRDEYAGDESGMECVAVAERARQSVLCTKWARNTPKISDCLCLCSVCAYCQCTYGCSLCQCCWWRALNPAHSVVVKTISSFVCPFTMAMCKITLTTGATRAPIDRERQRKICCLAD